MTMPPERARLRLLARRRLAELVRLVVHRSAAARAGQLELQDVLSDGDVLAAVPQGLRHPDELVEELVDGEERLVDEAAVLVEPAPDVVDVHVPEDRDEAELAEHRQQVLDDSRATEDPRRDADDPDSLVDVLGQVRVEHVLEQTWVAPVVLRGDEHERVGPVHRVRERGILGCLAGIVGRDRESRDVQKLGLDPVPLRHSLVDEPRRVLAHPTLPRCAEDHGDEQRPGDACLHRVDVTQGAVSVATVRART